MKKNIVYSLNTSVSELSVPRTEIYRYMASKGDESSEALIDEFFAAAMKAIAPKASFVRLEFQESNDEIYVGDICLRSKSLSRHLCGCGELIVLSLTLGHALDRLIARYSSLRPSAAFCINAIGSAAIESYADMLCRSFADELYKEGMHLTPRFSAGYGDLPLSVQGDMLNLSDAARRVGISLNKSLVMSPSKSVTALIGISKCEIHAKSKGCLSCGKPDCIYRRRANVK